MSWTTTSRKIDTNKELLYSDVYLKMIHNNKSILIRDYLTNLFLPKLNYNTVQDLYPKMKLLNINTSLKEKIKDQYDKLIVLSKGRTSPVFKDYDNYNGGLVSLEDFKGKYVYIDFWATWCKPCISQMPKFINLANKNSSNKNIAFLSISLDRKNSKDAWRKMIKDKKWNKIKMQLFADNGFNSLFAKNYLISNIPRYILIDPEGNILSAKAPNPREIKKNKDFKELFYSSK